MIIAGERSGSLSEVLITIGRNYEEKSDITTQNLEAILEPILLIIVWLGVMGVAVAVIMPIYSLVGGLDS
jgi:type IV pilus assembly protein PilC